MHRTNNPSSLSAAETGARKGLLHSIRNTQAGDEGECGDGIVRDHNLTGPSYGNFRRAFE
jgi:hypothetical protein